MATENINPNVIVNLTHLDMHLLKRSSHPELADLQGRAVPRERWDRIIKFLYRLNKDYWQAREKNRQQEEENQQGLLYCD